MPDAKWCDFVKHGDYWVHTSETAGEVGKILGLTVIKLRQDLYQIGFPDYLKDDNATKLLKAGYTALFEEPACFAE